MLHLKNAKLSNGNLEDIIIEGSLIKVIGRKKAMSFLSQYNKEVKTIDIKGDYLLKSFSDSHFHHRNPGGEYKQSYEEASDAAIKGGYTEVIAMANTNPVISNLEIRNEVITKSQNYPLTVYQIMSLTENLDGKNLLNFEEYSKYCKIYSDDGKNVDDENIMAEALRASEKYNFIIMDHSEPETEMVIRNIELLEKNGGHLHFCHVSKKASVQAIMKAKDKNLKVSFEVTPHHLFSHNLDYRVNPPIASKEDSEFLVYAIKEGYVDTIGTDHAPHSEEDKKKGAPGIANIETAFQMIWKVFRDNSISMETLEELMSVNTRKLLSREGRLVENSSADLVVVRDEDSKIDISTFVTRSKNSPFDKKETRGRIIKTFVKGKLVYDNE